MYQERIKVFENDDAGYEEWVARNWGYVLIRRSKVEYMLHLRDCSHLQRDQYIRHLTEKPRRWAERRHDLVDWCEAETGKKPLLCSDCF
jgi:hypothetical protein